MIAIFKLEPREISLAELASGLGSLSRRFEDKIQHKTACGDHRGCGDDVQGLQLVSGEKEISQSVIMCDLESLD
eukprot:765927-Hanusia_phi.AAC.6